MASLWPMAAVIALQLFVGAGALAVEDPAQEIERSRGEMRALQGRIGALQRSLASDEKRHAEAVAALRKAGRALSRLGARLRQTRGQRASVEAELARFQSEGEELQRRIEARRVRLGEWLRNYYLSGGEARLADFLAARSPNQLARDAYYLQRIGAANLDLISEQRDDIAALEDVARRIAERRDALRALEARQQDERRALGRARKDYRRQVAELGRRVREQKLEVSSLKLDERRLGKLISGLQRLAREREAEAEQRRREEPATAGGGQSTKEPVVARFRRQVVQVPDSVPFARLKGRLDAPLVGETIGRFGAARADGGAIWKGVFIRSAEGQEVRAVASGEVVFADWLRGFGNLVIIEHGDGYMTIYGNNDILVVTLGQKVLGGQAIASVGVDGGTGESGLYFEIRHRGEPEDPMKWVRR